MFSDVAEYAGMQSAVFELYNLLVSKGPIDIWPVSLTLTLHACHVNPVTDQVASLRHGGCHLCVAH